MKVMPRTKQNTRDRAQEITDERRAQKAKRAEQIYSKHRDRRDNDADDDEQEF